MGRIVHEEQIPTQSLNGLRKIHTPWRYFFKPDPGLMSWSPSPEDDIVTHLVMRINSERKGALVFSSGKDMGVFKASGWPEDVADFYRIQDYRGYLWLGHNRRFSPLSRQALAHFDGISVRQVVCTVRSAGVPADSWYQDPAEGGGILFGDVCHFIDLAVLTCARFSMTSRMMPDVRQKEESW